MTELRRPRSQSGPSPRLSVADVKPRRKPPDAARTTRSAGGRWSRSGSRAAPRGGELRAQKRPDDLLRAPRSARERSSACRRRHARATGATCRRCRAGRRRAGRPATSPAGRRSPRMPGGAEFAVPATSATQTSAAPADDARVGEPLAGGMPAGARASPAGSSSSSAAPPPAGTLQRSNGPCRSDANTTTRPSGDQDGSRSSPTPRVKRLEACAVEANPLQIVIGRRPARPHDGRAVRRPRRLDVFPARAPREASQHAGREIDGVQLAVARALAREGEPPAGRGHGEVAIPRLQPRHGRARGAVGQAHRGALCGHDEDRRLRRGHVRPRGACDVHGEQRQGCKEREPDAHTCPSHDPVAHAPRRSLSQVARRRRDRWTWPSARSLQWRVAQGFPSGQRGRAVNPLAQPSEVRILSPAQRGGTHGSPAGPLLLGTPQITRT